MNRVYPVTILSSIVPAFRLTMLNERSKELHRPYDQVFPYPKPCGQIIIEQSTLTGAVMEQRLSWDQKTNPTLNIARFEIAHFINNAE